MSPTRELTLQIYNEARKFVHGSVYRPVVAYGGTSVGHQLAQVERGANIVVGTPGRLMDFLRRGKVRYMGERGGRERGRERSASVHNSPVHYSERGVEM